MIVNQARTESLTHTGPLWRWTSAAASAAWFFITIDGAAGEMLAATALMRRLESGQARGFGAIKVVAQIGETCWSTSVFPAKDAAGYMLPVKASVRRSETLDDGDEVTLTLSF